MIDHASVVVLEKMLLEAGRNPSSIWLTPEKWDNFGDIADLWVQRTGRALALAIATVCSVIDFEAVIIDGGFSTDVRKAITSVTRRHLAGLNLQGIETPIVEEGLVGSAARAIGAASLPLFSRYHIDQSVLFKDMV